MEVHHHSHTEGKRLKHYLFEFLMLFLAVFCGFMAENLREHQVEKSREKEFMRSVVEDLQTDTASLGRIIPFGKEISGRISALVSFLNSESANDSIEKLYKLNIQAGRVVNVDFEDRTSSQLKNAGNMRLIRNKMVADSIRNYWSLVKTLESISARLDESRTKAVDIMVQLINNKYIHYSDLNSPLSSSITILPGAKLITDDPKLLAEYSNRRLASLVVLNTYINTMSRAKQTAIRLMETITNEYHLN